MSDQVTRLANALRDRADQIERGKIPITPGDELVVMQAPPALAARLDELARSGNLLPGILGLAEAALDFADGRRPSRTITAQEMRA